MTATENILQLTAAQADCLEALKQGMNGKTKIALHAKRDLRTVAAALEHLSRAKLVKRHGRNSWRPTKLGASCVADVIPDPKGRGRGRGNIVAGSAGDRLLATLDRPEHGRDLARRLGITRQRLLQLVVRFHAEGRLRIGDREIPTHIIARSGDTSILLTRDEERLLSALPAEAPTMATKLRAAISMPPERLNATISALQGMGLLAWSLSNKGVVLHALTAEGKAHFQRRPPLHFAEPPPLPVRSDRIRRVLSYLAEHGKVRIRDVGNDLGIPGLSMNGLMQYLKGKSLVTKAGKGLHDPYMLTGEGSATLSEMMRRSS